MKIEINFLITCLEYLRSNQLYKNKRIESFRVENDSLVFYFDETNKDWVSFKIKSIEKVSD